MRVVRAATAASATSAAAGSHRCGVHRSRRSPRRPGRQGPLGNFPGSPAEAPAASEGAVVMSSLLSGVSLGERRAALGGFGAHGELELGSANRDTEDRAAGFEEAAGAQTVQSDG